MKTCPGCDTRFSERGKYCPVCAERLREMREAGYLTLTRRQDSPTTFNDQRGRKIIDLGDATSEDDYSEDSDP